MRPPAIERSCRRSRTPAAKVHEADIPPPSCIDLNGAISDVWKNRCKTNDLVQRHLNHANAPLL
jgi:hypothetical protein